MLAYIPGDGDPLEDISEFWKNALDTSAKIFMQQIKSISYSSCQNQLQ